MARAFTLLSLLESDRIVVGLGGKTYQKAIGQLLDRLEASSLIEDRSAIEELVEAEASAGDLPALGSLTLLAHYRTDSARDLAVAIGTSVTPFRFAPATVPNARIVLLIVAPKPAAKYYLKIVAAFSRLLRERDVAEAIIAAESAGEVRTIVARNDVVIRAELTVHDLMSRRVYSVSPDTPLSEVARLMTRHHRRAVPVVSDGGEVIGLVTQLELLQQFLPQLLGTGVLAADEEQPLQDVETRDVMQRSVLCLSEDQLISDVKATMLGKGGVPYFPVVREGKLVGFLSRTDLVTKLVEPSLSRGK